MFDEIHEIVALIRSGRKVSRERLGEALLTIPTEEDRKFALVMIREVLSQRKRSTMKPRRGIGSY